MSDLYDETTDGISTDDAGLTCIEPSAWNNIIKATIALIIAEIVIFIAFMCIRSKRHTEDHKHGVTHAKKNWIRRKLKRNGHVE